MHISSIGVNRKNFVGDPYNGITFCRNHHRAFDSGNLSFNAKRCS
ncbi:MAG: HNH endonuclease [Promethearchaeota archaeon]